MDKWSNGGQMRTGERCPVTVNCRITETRPLRDGPRSTRSCSYKEQLALLQGAGSSEGDAGI